MILIAVLGLAVLFDYINGFHDTANAFATSVSTRALSLRLAIAISTASITSSAEARTCIERGGSLTELEKAAPSSSSATPFTGCGTT